MPMRCTSPRGCFWDPEPGDDDVSGHAITEIAESFDIAHPDDPEGGHLVRIRFEDPEEERKFLTMLEADRQALASKRVPVAG